MKVQKKLLAGRCGRTAVLLMLSPMMLLNVSQAMTLCVRGAGDVALELLVGDHCTCEMGAPDTDSGGALADTASSGMGAGDWPCLDIPIPTSSCDSRMSLAAAAHSPCFFGTAGPESAMVDLSCGMTRAARTFPTPHAPLETILLQV